MLLLERLIAQPLKELGFRKKSRTWWRHNDDTIQVLNLQKSPYGERMYVNLGIYVRALGTEDLPPENRCHLQVRLERVSNAERWGSVASAESDREPTPELIAAVLVDGVAWLDRLSTLAGIREYIDSGGASNGLVSSTVRQLLDALH